MKSPDSCLFVLQILYHYCVLTLIIKISCTSHPHPLPTPSERERERERKERNLEGGGKLILHGGNILSIILCPEISSRNTYVEGNGRGDNLPENLKYFTPIFNIVL